MSIGSLTLWNFGNKVRSHNFQYPLHLVTAKEKEEVCANLWQQHTDEMLLLEGNVLSVNEEKVTMEFQPIADQAWEFQANNVLTQSDTYPSLFANVHKSELSQIGKTIGHKEENTWKPPTMEGRREELAKLSTFKKSLPSKLTDNLKHKKQLEFVASNGIRQLGEPRTNLFADRQHPAFRDKQLGTSLDCVVL